MRLKKCKECGKLFSPENDEDLCPVCRNSEDEKYEKVKAYLWDNPNATVSEVHEETEVERELIIKFVKEGRLIADGLDVDVKVDCESCQKQIDGGKYCDRCKQNFVEELSDKDRKKLLEEFNTVEKEMNAAGKNDQKKRRGIHLKDRIDDKRD